MRGFRISYEQSQLLRAAYLRGDRISDAAELAGVAVATAHRHFHRFQVDGLVRPSRPLRPPRRKMTRWHTPTYTGPDWIG